MSGASSTDVCWEDKVWQQHFPLNSHTVLDYFSNSQFYDRTCINEQVKMQRNLPPEQLEQTMARMVGTAYVLHQADEVAPSESGTAHSLYVIQKQQQQPPQQPSVERLYYVLDGVVYQVPNLHALFSSRLQKLGWHLDGAFEACWAAARGEEQPTELDAAPTSQLR